MNGPGGPGRRGRHSSADDGVAGLPRAPWGAGSDPSGDFRVDDLPTGRLRTGVTADGAFATTGRPTVGFRKGSGIVGTFPDETGPVAEPAWWSHGSSDHPMSARHSGGSTPNEQLPPSHPSAPLPPRPAGVWDRWQPRADDDRFDDGSDDDTATIAQARATGRPPGTDDGGHDDTPRRPHDADGHPADDDQTDAHRLDPHAWEDHTGGLEVIGAHVEDTASRRPWSRGERHDRRPHPDDVHHDDLHHDDAIPDAPYDSRGGRRRRSRRPLAVLTSLVVLAGLIVGIVVGGEKLLGMINPGSRDFTGQGSGTAEIRISQGDTLSDIARTLVDGGVIASIGPFIDAAEADPDATGIQPGVYRMRSEMSGQAAVDLLLDPAARLVSRVTLPEGLTVEATLAKLAESTGTPIEELNAAAADPAALGLPAYANGTLEGFLFPATYDFEPDTTPAEMLAQMVTRAQQALDELQLPTADRLTVLTKASLVQAEASTTEDMAKVARVLENRLADGMKLQLDTTVNYANGKGGITTSATDRSNPSPYNTYMHAGLPPGAINNPGEDALRAVLSPADGDWRFFVVVDPDTGDTRFARTGEEHQQNVLLFQQWLRDNPGN